ncbi:MAG: TM0996/MTH895 family glutaredoxin-like protein [Ignavibacteria bacterium]|nr:TM0996/MTH895 family glutaredoxin-like protein [Ignavibacteria bacterium]
MLNIKVAGPGCMNCEKLYSMCQDILMENNVDAELEKVSDRDKITELGIWMTPGLIVNDKVLSQGKIPTRSTLEHWLLDASKN